MTKNDLDEVQGGNSYRKGIRTEVQEILRENQSALLLSGIAFGTAFLLGLTLGSKLNGNKE